MCAYCDLFICCVVECSDVLVYSEGILAGLKKQMDDGSSMKNHTIALMAAVVYSHDNVG